MTALLLNYFWFNWINLEYNTISDEFKYILFVKPKDPRRELWDGPVVGVELAKEYFKCNEVKLKFRKWLSWQKVFQVNKKSSTQSNIYDGDFCESS